MKGPLLWFVNLFFHHLLIVLPTLVNDRHLGLITEMDQFASPRSKTLLLKDLKIKGGVFTFMNIEITTDFHVAS